MARVIQTGSPPLLGSCSYYSLLHDLSQQAQIKEKLKINSLKSTLRA